MDSYIELLHGSPIYEHIYMKLFSVEIFEEEL